jgi:hypothetical protein
MNCGRDPSPVESFIRSVSRMPKKVSTAAHTSPDRLPCPANGHLHRLRYPVLEAL